MIESNYENWRKIFFRPLKRNAFCRGCDEEQKKGTMVISTYSIRGKGQHIYFCKSCVKEMYNLIKLREMYNLIKL